MEPMKIFLFVAFIWLFFSGCRSESRVVLAFHENGTPHEVLVFSRPITQDSIGTKYLYRANGKIQCQGGYKNGERHGDWVCYFQDGRVKWKGSFLEGLENGEIYCGRDNETWYKLTVKEGIPEGPTTEFNFDSVNNVSFLVEGQYKNGLESGTWSVTDTLGNVMSEITFESGIPIDTTYY
jgi:antitoxin component YwqK of YwqJK toxin-antitoxin module